MRTYVLAPAAIRRTEATARMARIAQAGSRIRRKPRSSEERAVIVKMAASGMRRRIAAGRLVQTGPRSWRVILRSDPPTAEPLHDSPAPIEGADR